MPSASAAILVSRSCGTCSWFVTLTSKPKRERWGNISRSKSICLEASISAKFARPVTLPPGCERLATNPKPTGSAPEAMTIGIVAFRAARLAGRRRGNDHAGIEAHQLVRQIRQPVEMTVGEPKLEMDVAALDISELMHALSKACQIAFKRFGGSGA